MAAVFRAAFGNVTLRRVGIAYSLFGAAEYGIWLALLVYAYGHGGATAGMLMVLVQLIPSSLLAPFIGALADRLRPASVLRVSYGLQAASIAAVAVAVTAGVPDIVVFVLAPLTSLSLTVTRPAQAALLPAIVRTPEELTAANVMTGWTEGAASLVGPTVVGALLAWRGAGLAVAATAAMTAVSALLVATLVGPAAAVSPGARAAGGLDDSGTEDQAGLGRDAGGLLSSLGLGVRSNLALARRNETTRVLLVLHTFYYALVGALDLLCVVLAVSILHIGAGGAGYLNASLGGGALLAGLVTAFLVGRRHLANTLTVSLLAAVAALAVLGVFPSVAGAFVLVACVGLGGTVFDITGRTLLQRAAPADAIAGSFAVLEALRDVGLASGAVLVRLAIAVGGLKAALFAPAAAAALLVAVLWRRLRRIDDAATVPHVEIQLLRSLAIFALLPPPSIEGVARELVAMPVPAGTVVITEGDRGDRYYAVADGELAVTCAGQLLQTVARGDGFGEIALVSDVPRKASVTAVTEAFLYALDKEPFVRTLTGHSGAAAAARRIVSGHLGDDAPPALPG
jgi:hypothetical protein